MSDFFNNVFTQSSLEQLFPKTRSNDFFDAMYGDADEGAYNIELEYKEGNEDRILFHFNLIQRPGKCLACNLTYGLPQVFTRHPVINIKTLVSEIGNLLDGKHTVKKWEIGTTLENSRELHVIPLTIYLD